MADKATWKFLENLPEEERFKISTIHPGLVIGPTFIKTPFESQKTICEVMNGNFRYLPHEFPFSDVRDVAEAHL